MVPTDFSKYSDAALKQAFDIAAESKATVYVLHVSRDKVHYAFTDDYEAMQLKAKDLKDLEGNIVKSIQSKMAEQVSRLLKDKTIKVIEDVVFGVPYEEILKEQKSRKIDLIVIASLGRSGIARFLLGSVARNVLKGAKCNVLLTK
jgi:nucleotide-binding universal stress UspA family protein